MVTIVYLRSYWSVTCFTYCTHTSVPDTTKDIKRMCTRRWNTHVTESRIFVAASTPSGVFLKRFQAFIEDNLEAFASQVLSRHAETPAAKHAWNANGPPCFQAQSLECPGSVAIAYGCHKGHWISIPIRIVHGLQCTCDELWYWGELFSLFSIWILVSSYSIFEESIHCKFHFLPILMAMAQEKWIRYYNQHASFWLFDPTSLPLDRLAWMAEKESSRNGNGRNGWSMGVCRRYE